MSRRRVAIVLDLTGWSMVAAMGVLAATQGAGWTGLPVVYAAQALTPYMLALAVPLAVVASSFGRHAMAVVSATIAMALLWLGVPVVFHAGAPQSATGAVEVTIIHANVYLDNEVLDEAARTLIDADADIVAVTEYSDMMRRTLIAGGLGATHPYRLDRASGDRDGLALFSRYPITAGEVTYIGHQPGIESTIDVDGTSVRVLVVHPLPGIDRASLQSWRDDMRTIADRVVAVDTPTVVVGDFNASRWHPAFRDLLDRGLTDAHEQLGRGFSVSWPEGWSLPKFVRLDHALVTDGLTATSIDDVTVPGSDHAAFRVTVTATTTT